VVKATYLIRSMAPPKAQPLVGSHYLVSISETGHESVVMTEKERQQMVEPEDSCRRTSEVDVEDVRPQGSLECVPIG